MSAGLKTGGFTKTVLTVIKHNRCDVINNTRGLVECKP